MRIQGVQKVTLLDFPGCVACTVFTLGCNFRCPFCHNASLVIPGEGKGEEASAFFSFLDTRRGKLDGVCISGGEPLLQPDIRSFIERIREKGFSVKLDTNGSSPDILAELMRDGLLDAIAMDIKNAPDRYAETCGLESPPIESIERSVTLIMTGGIPYEFRTTVVDEFHREDDFRRIGEWIRGASAYYLQTFVESEGVIQKGLHPASREKMAACLTAVSKDVPAARLRGGL